MARLSYFVYVVVVLNAWCCDAAKELLKNSDLESTSYTGNWYCQGNCHLTPSNDTFHGQHSVRVSNRTGFYILLAYVKLLSNVNHTRYQEVSLMIGCKTSNGKSHYNFFGKTPHVQHGKWYEVGGVERIPSGNHDCVVYIQTVAPTEYLMDQASVQEVSLPANWKLKAAADIDRIRKANIRIQLAGSADEDSNLEIELTQIEHQFVFGSAVSVDKLTDSSHMAYQKAFYDNFEWGVPENALKWRQMEHSKDHVNYDKPINAIKAMRAHGKKVRGHCIFWSVETYIQSWVKSLYGQALLSAIASRIQGVIGHTKGMLEQWDVNNENLHADFFERHTGNPDITMEMFRQVHAIDPKPALFLNDYNVISNSEMTVALKTDAVHLRNRSVPIGGIGIQSHLHKVDLAIIKGRLDILGEAGLPLMITELGVNDANITNRANKLSDLMYLFLSHPSVEGIMFWGFWDGSIWEKDAPLFTGTNVTPNAAGLVYQNLKKLWTTHATRTIQGYNRLTVRGFKGTYRLNVKHNGQILKTEVFTLGDNGINLDVHLLPSDSIEAGSPGESEIVRVVSRSTTEIAEITRLRNPDLHGPDTLIPSKQKMKLSIAV